MGPGSLLPLLFAGLTALAAPAEPPPAPAPAAAAAPATSATQADAPAPAAEPAPEGPPPPEALVAIGGDEYVSLSWLPSPVAGILGYNVYRSTREGEYGTVPVNRSLVTGTEFNDDEKNSTGPPENGVVYWYIVRAVDEQGRLSVPSEEGRARPEGAPVITEIPKVEYGFGESQLSVSGRKVVSLGYTVRTPKNAPGTSQLSGPQSQRLDLQQQLQVRLNGTVGKKISVDVDYDDTAPETTRQRISVVYAGDAQETIERAEFGDIRLQLSDTEFTGYDKQLFGVRLQARPIEKLKATLIATQTQGINASEQFIGSSAKQEVEFTDLAYVSHRYFYIARPALVTQHLGIKPGSEQVWLDDGVPGNNVPGVTVTIGTFNFDRQFQGVDYSIDYATGVLNFNRSVSNTAAIAVSFQYGDGTEVFFGSQQDHDIAYVMRDPSTGFSTFLSSPMARLESRWDITQPNWAETTRDAHLIFDGPHTGGGDAHMITNWYQLGHRNIVPKDFDPEFTIRVFDASGNEVLGIINPVLDSDFYDFGILKLQGAQGRGGQAIQPSGYWTSPQCLTVPQGFPAPACYPNRTLVYADGQSATYYESRFCEPPAGEQPFAWDVQNNFYCAGGNAYPYGTVQRFSSPRYRVRLRFLTRVLSYRLRNINIVRGSERITLDGRTLSRDIDYFFDYDFGQVTFLRPEQVRFDSRIQMDYEYLPFGGQFQSFLWGARGQYTLSDKTGIGVTYLNNAAQNPADVPSPTAAPKKTEVMGLDGRTFLSRRDLSQLVQILPGFEKTILPLEMEIRGEVARSDINPNSWDPTTVDEKGVAMIDSMEGVDDTQDTGVEASTWFPSSAPEVASTLSRTGTVAWKTEQGGHFSDLARRLDIHYEGLEAGEWDGLRYVMSPVGLDLTNYQYLEMWVHGDGSGNELGVSLGVISEDSNGNAVFDTEDRNGDFALNAGEDTGIGGPGNPAFWGATGAMTVGGTAYPGPGGTLLNTEDMNGNGVLDTTNRYFEYRFPVSWTGWNFVKIPLSFTQLRGTQIPVSTTNGPITVDFDKSVSEPDRSVIRHARLWLKGTGGQTAGTIKVEQVSVTGNRWMLRTPPGSPIPTDPGKFNVAAISQETSPAYVPRLTYFLNRSNETDAERREQSLRIDYNLYDDLGQTYFASRSFPTAINLLDYQELRFDIYKANSYNRNQGEILYVRAGGDDRNYFQFNIPLDTVGPGWQTVTINLRDERNRSRVGTPTLSGVKQFALGVIRYDPPAASITEQLWINNLRLVSPEHKSGFARKANVRMSTPMGATFIVDPNQEILPSNAGIIVDTSYREIDNDFRLIDQPTFLQNDQHRRSVNTQVQVRQIPKLPITANWRREDSYVESHHRDDPVYFFAPDRVNENVQTTVSSQHLNPVSLEVSTARSEDTVHYLTGIAGADFNRVQWSAAPQARAPLDGWWFGVVPVGSGGEARGSVRYSKERLDYQPSLIFKNLEDRTTETLDEQYDARTTYRPLSFLKKAVPLLSGLSASPRGGYQLSRSRGIIGSVQVANIQDPTSINSAGRFVPVRQEVSAGLDSRLDSLKGITPMSNWTARSSRDFTRLSLSTNSTLTNSLDWRPGEWWTPMNFMTWNGSYVIDTNAQYADVIQRTFLPGGGSKTETIDPITRRVPFKDLWWVNRKDDNLSTSNAFSETWTAGGRLLAFKLLSFTPNWSFRENTRLAQKLRSREVGTTASLGLSLERRDWVTKFFSYTPLFWMKLNGLDSSYSFRKSTTFDFKDRPTNISEQHTANASTAFSPVPNMTGNISVAANTSLARVLPAIKTVQRNVQPSINLGYSKSAGIEFPLIWWRIKLSNLFRVNHTFQMNFINNESFGQRTGNRTAQEIQDFTEFEYEMLRGINLRFRAQYDQVKDFTTPLQSFQAFSFFGTFLFNF